MTTQGNQREMRATARPRHAIEKILALVLVAFIAVDLLLVSPAFAAELGLGWVRPMLSAILPGDVEPADPHLALERSDAASPELLNDSVEVIQDGPSGPTPDALTYEVQRGDTLWRIAQSHGTTVDAVAAANRLANPNLIFAGQLLIIPSHILDYLATQPGPVAQGGNDDANGEAKPSATASESSATPPPTVDSLETAVVQTATALALPSATPLPSMASSALPSDTPTSTGTQAPQEPSATSTLAPTSTPIPSQTPAPTATQRQQQPTVANSPVPTATPIPSYTPTSTRTPIQPVPSMTPTKVAVLTATSICVACQATALPTATPTAIPTSTPFPTYTSTAIPASELLPAFPGAEGWGAESVGGRGGQVIEVTNLDNSGPGSLRACAQDASGPRICVFRVAGEIVLTGGRLKIRNPYLTIAGQTAPGGGITLRGGDSQVRPILQFEDGVHDVIVRYLTIRAGQGFGERDGITFRGGHDIILDHVSLEWATDELIGINPDVGESVSNVTIQRSILAETFQPHSTGLLITGENDLSQITLHHNLFAHNGHRNPRVDRANRVEFTNNVVYNWHSRVGTTVADAEVDFVANYFEAGPWSAQDRIILHEHIDPSQPDIAYSVPSIYAEDNVAIPYQPDASADNWHIFRYHYGLSGSLPDTWRRSNPNPSRIPVTLESAQAAYESVLEDAGNNARLDRLGRWVVRLDTVDRNIISDVVHGTGPTQDSEIDHQDDFGGFPPIERGVPYSDTDHDGMPDEWERQSCLDPEDGSDGASDADRDGYTNLEEFLNGTRPLTKTCSG